MEGLARVRVCGLSYRPNTREAGTDTGSTKDGVDIDVGL